MLSFFRINDPFRLIFIFGLLLVFRLPAIVHGLPLSLLELNWMLVGEKMAEGKALYSEIRDTIAPLSAFVYGLMDSLFGRSQPAYQLVSFILVFFQCILFNNILIESKTFSQNTYVPALIYAVLMSWFFDFYTLSPQLMSMTFVLLTIGNILQPIDRQIKDGKILRTGFSLGLAGLFYLPSLFFALAVILGFWLFTGVKGRQQLLFFYGLLLPVAVCVGYYYWQGSMEDLGVSQIYALFQFGTKNYLNLNGFMFISIVPLLFVLLSIFKANEGERATNNQSRYQQLMFLLLICGLLAAFIVKEKSPVILILLVPSITYFLSRYFLAIQKRWMGEALFLMFTLGVLLINYGSLFQLAFPGKYVKMENLVVQPTPWDDLVKGKKVLMMGDKLDVYKDASLATPYLNWPLAALQFDHPDYYDNLTSIYNSLQQDTPEVLIDPENRYQDLLERMPGILKNYRYEQFNENGLYLLKNKQ
ncbi:DUF6427 family protein [Xanthovirga aplysinae]|uniref:DUF6427 family protein n=1 Tax=Xanthovirga aplysinae TaxID=2529853 RepID=UPI0012BD2BE7|nr:DUF6427 family protein [Xanthovirga aplysinae]MTI32208.1 hypothetical protein [Xanthovirga aplysinae]